mmetsp:Transcript_118577/g.230810  ORF Transcript_118577/g.230810 Transcript_118577/m.230810 type:complete len:203 (+) Transcript_118577:2177-2785(+)
MAPVVAIVVCSSGVLEVGASDVVSLPRDWFCASTVVDASMKLVETLALFVVGDSVVTEVFATAVVTTVISPAAVVIFGTAAVENGSAVLATLVDFLAVGFCHGFVQGAVELAVEVLGGLMLVVVVVGGTVSTIGPALKVHFCCSFSSSQGCMEIELTNGLSGVSSCKQWLSSRSPSCSRPVTGSNLHCWLASTCPPLAHGQM